MSNKTNKIIFNKPVLSSSRLPESVLAAERERIKQGVSSEAMEKAEKDFDSLPEDMKQKFYRTFGKTKGGKR